MSLKYHYHEIQKSSVKQTDTIMDCYGHCFATTAYIFVRT